MKDNNAIKKIFKLYLERKTNRQQEEILSNYLADPKNKDSEFYEHMEEVWQNEPIEPDKSLESIQSQAQIWSKLQQKKQKKTQRYKVFKYAASITLFVSLSWCWYSYNNKSKPNTPIQLISKRTRIGEKIKIMLPDSSIVYLSGGSKLTWPSLFKKSNSRNVCLEGEAFFEVKKDITSPFIIQSGKIQTQVLGTSFNVYAYPADKVFSVAVRTGKVKVSENFRGKLKELSLLTSGMKLVYSKHSGKYVIKNEPVEEVNSWVDNKFVFRNKNFAEMLQQLSRYYDIKFELKNPKLTQCQFNATFFNKSINDVMEQIRIMSGNHIKYKININNKTIALWGEGCQ